MCFSADDGIDTSFPLTWRICFNRSRYTLLIETCSGFYGERRLSGLVGARSGSGENSLPVYIAGTRLRYPASSRRCSLGDVPDRAPLPSKHPDPLLAAMLLGFVEVHGFAEALVPKSSKTILSLDIELAKFMFDRICRAIVTVRSRRRAKAPYGKPGSCDDQSVDRLLSSITLF